MTKFNCLINFTSWDIRQYVYCICSFPGYDVLTFEIEIIFLAKLLFFFSSLIKVRKNWIKNLKVVLWPSKKVDFIWLVENPWKNKQNAFYFILRAFSVLKTFTIWSDFFGHVEKRLDQKAKVIFKNYDDINWEANSYNAHIT